MKIKKKKKKKHSLMKIKNNTREDLPEMEDARAGSSI